MSVWDVYIVWLSRVSEQCSVPSAYSVSKGSAKSLTCLGRRAWGGECQVCPESLVRLHFLQSPRFARPLWPICERVGLSAVSTMSFSIHPTPPLQRLERPQREPTTRRAHHLMQESREGHGSPPDAATTRYPVRLHCRTCPRCPESLGCLERPGCRECLGHLG